MDDLAANITYELRVKNFSNAPNRPLSRGLNGEDNIVSLDLSKPITPNQTVSAQFAYLDQERGSAFTLTKPIRPPWDTKSGTTVQPVGSTFLGRLWFSAAALGPIITSPICAATPALTPRSFLQATATTAIGGLDLPRHSTSPAIFRWCFSCSGTWFRQICRSTPIPAIPSCSAPESVSESEPMISLPHLNRVFLVALAMAAAIGPALAQRVGVNSAVNPAANGTPPGAPTHQLVIGQEVVHNEHIVTNPNGQTQILFLDGSAMTIAPNSDLTIDDFVYDPRTDKGEMVITVTTGVFRFVGGKLSKNNPVTFYTPTGTVSVRGAVLLLDVAPHGGKLQAALLFGKEMKVTGNCAGSSKDNTQCPPSAVTRPGFAVSINAPGTAPYPAPLIGLYRIDPRSV